MAFPMMTDNSEIFYLSQKDGAISKLNLATGQTQIIRKLSIGTIFNITWSPSGSEAIITSGDKTAADDKNWFFSSKKNILTQYNQNISNISLSGSGSKISYITTNEDEDLSFLNISSLDGSNPKLIYSFDDNIIGNDNNFSWSKDDKYIAVSVGPTDVGASESFILNVKDGSKTKLSNNETGNIGTWSADSQKMTFYLFDNITNNYILAVKNPLDINSKEIKLNTDSETIWSTNSRSLVGNNTETIWKIDSQKGSKKTIYQPKIKENLPIDHVLKFDENNRLIYFFSNDVLYKVLIKN